MEANDNIVIVIDLSNYKSAYTENVPFKAQIVEKREHEVDVISLSTFKQYEIYYNQVLEFLDIKKLRTFSI